MDKNFSAKITVEGSQNAQAKLLSQKIKEDNSPIVTTTPDFTQGATTDEGLIKGVDKDGETYYFRGAVQDNYVKIQGLKYPDMNEAYILFDKKYSTLTLACQSEVPWGAGALWSVYGYNSIEECLEKAVSDRVITKSGPIIGEDFLFRIVRINGSGTIRIISENSIGKNVFNEQKDNEKYKGYTYDNSSPNVQDGTDSTIKTYLDSWYINNTDDLNIEEYNNLFANERYCNYNYNYSSGPSFICPITEKTYGGEYDLKIGLITSDELTFAGLSDYNFSNYMTKSFDWLIGSSSRNDTPPIQFKYVTSTNTITQTDNLTNSTDIVPVLNLKSNVLYSSGNGTKTDPYIVKLQ